MAECWGLVWRLQRAQVRICAGAEIFLADFLTEFSTDFLANLDDDLDTHVVVLVEVAQVLVGVAGCAIWCCRGVYYVSLNRSGRSLNK